MGFLFYDNEPGKQLLVDSALSAAFGNFWTGAKAVRSIANAAFPEASNSLNNYVGAKLSGAGSFLTQQNSALALTGTKTLSLLVSGNPLTKLGMAYDLLEDGEIVFSHEDGTSNINEEEFNNNFITFTIPDHPITKLTEGRVRITVKGDGDLRVSNPKFEDGSSPTRYSTAEGEPDVAVPITFTGGGGGAISPESQGQAQQLFPGENGAESPGTPGETLGGDPGTVQSGEPSSGVDFSELFKEFDKFVENQVDILESLRQQQVNQKNSTFYPDDKELDCLKFTRDKLKNHMNMVIGTSSRSRAFVSMAKVTLAGMRRSYEMRMHSRLSFYSFAFIDNWLSRLSLLEKHSLVHRGAGDSAESDGPNTSDPNTTP